MEHIKIKNVREAGPEAEAEAEVRARIQNVLFVSNP
jgi:hypothetical protein